MSTAVTKPSSSVFSSVKTFVEDKLTWIGNKLPEPIRANAKIIGIVSAIFAAMALAGVVAYVIYSKCIKQKKPNEDGTDGTLNKTDKTGTDTLGTSNNNNNNNARIETLEKTINELSGKLTEFEKQHDLDITQLKSLKTLKSNKGLESRLTKLEETVSKLIQNIIGKEAAEKAQIKNSENVPAATSETVSNDNNNSNKAVQTHLSNEPAASPVSPSGKTRAVKSRSFSKLPTVKKELNDEEIPEGPWKGGKFTGHVNYKEGENGEKFLYRLENGKLFFNGTTYEGEFKSNDANNLIKGTKILPDDTAFTNAIFRDDKANTCETGIKTLNDGTVFDGTFRNDEMNTFEKGTKTAADKKSIYQTLSKNIVTKAVKNIVTKAEKRTKDGFFDEKGRLQEYGKVVLIQNGVETVFQGQFKDDALLNGSKIDPITNAKISIKNGQEVVKESKKDSKKEEVKNDTVDPKKEEVKSDTESDSEEEVNNNNSNK